MRTVCLSIHKIPYSLPNVGKNSNLEELHFIRCNSSKLVVKIYLTYQFRGKQSVKG